MRSNNKEGVEAKKINALDCQPIGNWGCACTKLVVYVHEFLGCDYVAKQTGKNSTYIVNIIVAPSSYFTELLANEKKFHRNR